MVRFANMKIDTIHIDTGYQPIVTDSLFFETFDPQYLTRATRGSVDRLNALHADMKTEGIKSALDIGCNAGFFCHALQARGFEMTGIDNDEHSRAHELPSVIGLAQELSTAYGIKPKFIKGDYALNLETRYDAVLCLSVFHHLFRSMKRATLLSGQDFKITEQYIKDVLANLFQQARKTLYLEMSTVFPEVVELGWTKKRLPKIIEEVTGAKPEVIHTSPDAHLEPRLIYAIRHK